MKPQNFLSTIRTGKFCKASKRIWATSVYTKRDTTDLEQYALSLLLRHPHVLNVIDEALDRAELPPLNVDDFEQLACREIFRALRSALIDDPAPTPDAVRAGLDESLYPPVEALYKETGERPPVDRRISLEDGARKAGLLLREKRFRREGQQLRSLLQRRPPMPKQWRFSRK